MKANPTPSQFGAAGRPTTSMSNGQSMNITGEPSRDRAQGNVLNALLPQRQGLSSAPGPPALKINDLPTAVPGDRLGRSAGDPTPVDNHVEVKLYHEWQVVEEKMFIGAVRIEASSGAIQQARDVALSKVTHV